MPTDDSSAEDTTTGRPICSAIRRQAATPPSGCTLSTAMSAASSRATRSGSSARRIDSSAATGTSTWRRTAASSSTVRQGCSTYSSPTRSSSQHHPDGGVDVPAAVGVDPHLAARPERVADGLDPRQVVGLGLAGLGDLDLGGAAAGRGPDDVGRGLRPDRRHGDVDRHRRRAAGRASRRRRPRGRRRSHGTHSRGVVVPERRPLAPAGGAAQQHALADVDAAEPGAHRQRPDDRAAPSMRLSSPTCRRPQCPSSSTRRLGAGRGVRPDRRDLPPRGRRRAGPRHGADRLRPARGAQRVPPAHRRRALPGAGPRPDDAGRRLRAAHRQRAVGQGRRLGVLLRR